MSFRLPRQNFSFVIVLEYYSRKGTNFRFRFVEGEIGQGQAVLCKFVEL